MPVQPALAGLLALAFALPAGAVKPGERAPAFEGAALADGAPIPREALRGKVVYLDFWASWCGPCRLSLPWMDRLGREFGERGLAVLAVNVDERRDDALAFLRRFPASVTVAADPRGAIATLYDVQDMPTSYVIDRRGVVRAVHRGFNPQVEKSVRDALPALLAEQP